MYPFQGQVGLVKLISGIGSTHLPGIEINPSRTCCTSVNQVRTHWRVHPTMLWHMNGQGFQQVQLEKMSPPRVFFSETNLAHFFGFPKMVTFPPSYIWMCILILQLPGGIHKFNSKVGCPSVPKKHPHPLSWNKKSLGFFGHADIFKWFLHPLFYSLKLKNWTHPNVVNSGFLLDTTSYPAARYIFFFFQSNMSPDTFGMDSLWLGLRKHQ